LILHIAICNVLITSDGNTLIPKEASQIENYSSFPTIKILVEESLNALQNNDSEKVFVLLDLVKDQLSTLTNQSSLPDNNITRSEKHNIRTFEDNTFGFEVVS
jgi:hypothetical protein